MNVLVDTSVWSLALRKKTVSEEEQKIIKEFKELIYEKRVAIIGPIRQELLSGISDNNIFEKLKTKMGVFEDETLQSRDYLKAAEINNLCRKNGVQGSHIDFLITATALIRHWAVFTTDNDFVNYSNIVDVKLHQVRKEIL